MDLELFTFASIIVVTSILATAYLVATLYQNAMKHFSAKDNLLFFIPLGDKKTAIVYGNIHDGNILIVTQEGIKVIQYSLKNEPK